MTQFLRAIWPSYSTTPNSLPESAGISTRDMTSYFLFWLVQLPFFFLNPNQLRWAFLLKTVVVPVTMLATMGALVHSAGGGGPLFDQPNSVTGKGFSQAWLIGFAALQGNWATLSVNSSDFTRYSKTARAQWSQALAIPLSALFVTICGILAASASIPVYGLAIEDAMWSPFDIMDRWNSRAATAFAALAWMLAGYVSRSRSLSPPPRSSPRPTALAHFFPPPLGPLLSLAPSLTSRSRTQRRRQHHRQVSRTV